MTDFEHKLFDEVYTLGKINSTVARSLKMIKQAEANGNFLVISDEQMAGHGRNKKSWFSPDGGIYMSANLYGLIVEPSLTLFVGICIHKALLDSFPYLKNDLHIKWPNDIYLDNLKLGGILTVHQPRQRYHSIGIGLNTNIDEFPAELQATATSLLCCLHFQIDNQKLIDKIFDHFMQDFPDYIEHGLDQQYYNQYSFLAGKEVVLDSGFDHYQGICKGINKNGALVLQLPSKMIQPFYAGSIISWQTPQD
ncbi:MAG: biotin--[acetyl-CoA-carboxylase] ligase [Candidatus Cloacimonadales bacterium]